MLSTLLNFPGQIKGYYKVQNQGNYRELYLPENRFKTSYTVYVSKRIKISETWKSMEGMEFKFEFFFQMPFYIVTQYNMKIILST